MGAVQAGTSMTWTEKEAVELRLGNPGYVYLTVNGKKEPPSSVNTQGGAPVTLSYAPGDQDQPSAARPGSPARPAGEPCRVGSRCV